MTTLALFATGMIPPATLLRLGPIIASMPSSISAAAAGRAAVRAGLVVADQQLDLTSIDAACVVDLIDRHLNGVSRLDADVGCSAFEPADEPYSDRILFAAPIQYGDQENWPD